MKKKPHRYVIYRIFRFLLDCLGYLPHRACLWFGRCLGKLVFKILKKERKQAINNLSMAFSSEKNREKIEKIACESFENMGMTLTEMAWMRKASPDKVFSCVSIDENLLLDRFKNLKNGGIIVTAHLGNWELIAAYACWRGYRIAAIAKRIYFEPYNTLLIELRQKFNVETIYRDESPRKTLQWIQKGGFLGILADQDVDSVDGVFVDFFGKSAYTPLGPALIALAARVPMLPSFIIRNGDKHEILLGEPIFPNTDGEVNKEEESMRLTRAWSKAVEKMIRKYPHLWVWHHRRWKTRPDKSDGMEKSA
ncbi:MAG: lysophospholipid acyltransferase family protein [Candidatus Theseobacter exili]|nr:lysophospholipid acyltransferase family protein [Candidatus Theseobacter exili]